MKSRHGVRTFVGGMAAILCLSICPAAWAELCFTSFGGTVHLQFATTAAALKAAGTQTFGGRVFGALSPCAGLKEWPVTATKDSKTGQIILAFRAMTVDAAGCGAVDEIVNLNPKTLSGPLQLHNDRNNFSNTSTLVPAACILPLSKAAPQVLELKKQDLQGNTVQ